MVIGWGNPSRRDDAIGHHVIDALKTILPQARHPNLLKAHQLDVTLAKTVASQDLVVFVDASVASDAHGSIRVQPLVAEPIASHPPTSHSLTPAELLAVVQWLYGRAPHAVLVAVKGHDFSFAEGLSVPARSAVAEAARVILDLLSGFDHGQSTD